jgi:phosphoribosylaminoimidazolecarboxamide formyltransferase/IMP cyclohydrolase
VKLLSTGGTARLLPDAGLPVTEVAEHTGFPEMLDGRVKTLHPRIHGGLLARRDLPAHMAALQSARHRHHRPAGGQPVPVRGHRAKAGCTLEDAIENIDIGGPAMVRAAAKNWQDVAVLTDAAEYAGVLAELQAGGIAQKTKFALARGGRVQPHQQLRRHDQRLPVGAAARR